MATLYFLPGNQGRLDKGLGAELMRRGFSLAGRENLGAFQKLGFAEKIQCIADDLKNHFCHHDAHVIANSFGAYLFLHAQSLMPPFVGKVLLLSPITGEASDVEHMRFYVPPHAAKLGELAAAGNYPAPTRCEIHVGEDDWQAVPARLLAFARPLGIPVTVIPNAGHRLDRDYVCSVLDRWLPAEASHPGEAVNFTRQIQENA